MANETTPAIDSGYGPTTDPNRVDFTLAQVVVRGDRPDAVVAQVINPDGTLCYESPTYNLFNKQDVFSLRDWTVRATHDYVTTWIDEELD